MASWSSEIKDAEQYAYDNRWDKPRLVVFECERNGRATSIRHLSLHPDENEVLVSNGVKYRMVGEPIEDKLYGRTPVTRIKLEPIAKDGKAESYKTSTFKSGGQLQEPTVGSQTKVENSKNHALAEHMAKQHGMRLRLLPNDRKAPKGIPQPDCLDLDTGNKVELKICEPKTSNAKSSIQNAIKEGSRQGCQQIIVEFNGEVSTTSIYQGLMAALQPGRAGGVQELIIKFSDDSLKRININVWRKRIEEIRKKRAK